jgi:hypothetical protein
LAGALVAITVPLAGLSGLRDSEIGIGGMEYYDNLFDRDLVETGIRAGRPD